MTHEKWSIESIREFRWMMESPMPEHNIHTKHIYIDNSKTNKETENTETQDKKLDNKDTSAD